MLGTEPAIEEAYVKAGLVQMVFNPVLNHGDRSIQSHQAAECAAEQGQFWAFRRVLFENQNALFSGTIQETLKQLAAQSGLDKASFNSCLDEQRTLNLVRQQDEVRLERGIYSQPSFDLNDQRLIGGQPFSIFQGLLDNLLAQ